MNRKFSSLLLAAALLVPVGIVGCARSHYGRSTGQYVDDKAVSSRVHEALAEDAEYKFDGVNVTTFRRSVQLSGFVNTDNQKSKAGKIAKDVEGVDEVINNISVKETK